MATAETRTGLIGLSVAMLGQAPGTGRLNEWVEAVDGGMSLSDLANHIADSDGFQATYPAFLTNGEFAEDFLGNVLGGNVSDALMAAVAGTVEGLLNDGMSRGELALAVVGALHDIADAGEDHAAYADLGMAAMAFANQVAVASHYTLEARMADPSADALAGVTADADSATMAIDAIDNPPVTPETMQVPDIKLKPTIDVIKGGDADDMIIAEPIKGADNLFNATLNSFDSIDGGGGSDTIKVYGVNPSDTLRLGAEDISNVENVVINTVGSIDADLSDWTGLEMVTLDRFGQEDEHYVKVTVDGATVTVGSDRGFNGDVTIVGAAGAVDIEASDGSTVHIGSAGHTETVMVEGGASVMVDNGAGKQSETVTSVNVDGVTRHPGGSTGATDPDESGVREATIPSGNSGVTPSATDVQYVRQLAEGETDDDSDGVTPVTAIEAALNTYYIADQEEDNLPEGVTLAIGMILVTSDVTKAEGYVEGSSGTSSGVEPTLKVFSNAIERIHLTETDAIVLVENDSKDEDDKGTPEDLSVTVAEFGGKLCLQGDGTSENVMIETVADAKESSFALASNSVKTISIKAGSDLELDVYRFDNETASTSLESVTIAGAGDVTMNDLAGMRKLKSIDASESEGDNSFKSQAGSSPADSDQLAALTMVMGGSGKDTVTLRTSVTGKLESVDTGAGNDTVTVTGLLRNDGLMVDLGAGDDVYFGRASNSESRIDGGDGTDVLRLTTTANSTYRGADNKTHSIYSGFETLNVAGGVGDYDIAQLGIVNDILVTASTASTAGAVTLENMGDGMGIRVSGTQGLARNTDNEANIVHELAERQSGQSRASGELDLVLTAIGFNDTRVSTEGEVELTLTTGDDIEVINITSTASPHSRSSTAASQRAKASDYVNELSLTSSAVEELIIDGNAALVVTGGNFASLKLVDAGDNSGGVTFNAADPNGDGTNPLTADLELVGGSGVDTLTGGSGEDEIMGGLGGDMLAGGDDGDDFVIDSASESQARFAIVNGVNTLLGGYDTITDFSLTEDHIDLSRSLLSAVSGDIKNSVTDWNDWQLWDADSDPSTPAVARYTSIDGDADVTDGAAKNLATFIGNGSGLFESRETDDDASDVNPGMITTKYSIAVISQEANDGAAADAEELAQGIWLLFDVDGDGDFDASNDMVIFLQETAFDSAEWDAGGDGTGIFI